MSNETISLKRRIRDLESWAKNLDEALTNLERPSRTELLARMAAEIAASLMPRFPDDEIWGPDGCSEHKARIEQAAGRGVIADVAVDIARRILEKCEAP